MLWQNRGRKQGHDLQSNGHEAVTEGLHGQSNLTGRPLDAKSPVERTYSTAGNRSTRPFELQQWMD